MWIYWIQPEGKDSQITTNIQVAFVNLGRERFQALKYQLFFIEMRTELYLELNDMSAYGCATV
jgi:hypothetical protein